MRTYFLLLFLGIFFFQSKADVRLPQFFNDNMVLQRDREVKIWGWANKKEKVSVSFNGQIQKTRADKSGKWEISLDAMKASSNPLQMTIKGKNEILLKNILIGDVWICGGQSNMEWPVSSSNNFATELENARYPNIRLLEIPRLLDFKPSTDVQPTEWKSAEGDNISRFSGVGYFFGRHIHENHGIPIGLISSNWGGTRAETWTSAEGLKPFEYTAEALQKMKDMDGNHAEKQKAERAAISRWMDDYFPKNDPGDKEKWYANDFDFSGWDKMNIPSALEKQAGLEDFDGVIWLKTKFKLTKELYEKDLFLRLGTVRNLDVVYLNGVKIINNQNPKIWRSYLITKDAFKKDEDNIITIKLFNPAGEGGLVEPNTAKFAISPAKWQITQNDISLVGPWSYKVSQRLEAPITVEVPQISKYQPNDYPSSLYNGMLHPLIPMAIKGAIWYQGEANAKNFEDAIRYKEVFSNMIKDWRSKWGYDFDFHFVQLANYWNKEEACGQPCEQSWAYIRESQLQTLSLPHTGMAVITDVGDANDIHPRDKQTVGKRLGLIADAISYGQKEVVYSGPSYLSHEVKGPEIWLKMAHIGSGMIAKDRYGYLRGFQIAGADKVFHWAKAQIEGDRIVVRSDKVQQAVAVRYAWENNPEDANLYNKEGLPASSFRTDKWKLSQKK